MWIRRATPALARMPSMRPHPLNPRAPIAPGSRSSGAAPSVQVSMVQAAVSAPAASDAMPVVADVEGLAAKAARAGGFHESSYELQHGLQVSESEWPDDVTIPGALGER